MNKYIYIILLPLLPTEGTNAVCAKCRKLLVKGLLV